VACFGLRAAMELILRLGVEAIAERIADLREQLLAELSALRIETSVGPDSATRSGILSLTWPDMDASAVAQQLEKRQILVNPRNGRLRVALHAWNNADDLQRLTMALQDARTLGRGH
jgi:selenocysteine lyase/cysteine desulfurase